MPDSNNELWYTPSSLCKIAFAALVLFLSYMFPKSISKVIWPRVVIMGKFLVTNAISLVYVELRSFIFLNQFW